MRDMIQLISQINLNSLPDTDADTATLASIMTIAFSIAGALALLMLVIGGLRYIISRGEPNATAQAKNQIIYSIIGLIVVIVSASIVALVVSVV